MGFGSASKATNDKEGLGINNNGKRGPSPKKSAATMKKARLNASGTGTLLIFSLYTNPVFSRSRSRLSAFLAGVVRWPAHIHVTPPNRSQPFWSVLMNSHTHHETLCPFQTLPTPNYRPPQTSLYTYDPTDQFEPRWIDILCFRLDVRVGRFGWIGRCARWLRGRRYGSRSGGRTGAAGEKDYTGIWGVGGQGASAEM